MNSPILRRPRRASTPLFALLLFCAFAPAAAAQDASVEAAVDSLAAAYDSSESPGVLIAVVQDGEIVFQKAYGMANLAHGVPLTVDTRTNIGSTSKQFTAFALGLLASRGELSLDDDVRDHIPELPDFGETVTVRNLLTHTSGYREFLNALAIGGWDLQNADFIARREIVGVVERQPRLQNSPGTEYNYNNTGYALAAMVVERVTGESFPAWMAANVFEPIGMTNTLVRADRRQIVPNSAMGYLPHPTEGFREATDLPGAMGAGGIYTTLGDLALWLGNLGSGAVGGPALIEEMMTPFVLASGEAIEYGLGLIIVPERGVRRVIHGGADTAHRSHLAFYPDLGIGIIVQSNHAGFQPSVIAGVTELFVGEHMEPLPAPAEPEATEDVPDFDADAWDRTAFDDFAGRYAMEAQPAFVLTFWRDGERLMTQATGQGEAEIIPTSDSTFRHSTVAASVTFHRDAEGIVTGLTLHQNGNHPARRLEEEAPVVDLEPFTGRYYSAEFETFYTIALEDGGLVLQHRRLATSPLMHESGDTFAGTFPMGQLEFERDEAGVITGFRASNGRARDILFERMP